MAPDARELPASVGQRLMWLLERVEGVDGALNLSFALRLRGTVDTEALIAALWDLTERHEALRTTFAGRGPGLTQLIQPAEPRCKSAVQALAAHELDLATELGVQNRHRFELGSEWPVRFRLYECGPDDHVLLAVLHHIAVDGTSIGVLIEELWTAYEARVAGTRCPPPTGWQQGEFTEWQRTRLSDGSVDGAIERLRAGLGDYQPVELPATLRPVEIIGHPGSGRFKIDVPHDVTERLRALAGRQRATVFAALVAGLTSYLVGPDADRPVLVPVMFANRGRPAAQRTVGFLASLVLLPMDVSDRPGFELLIRRARNALLDGLIHQEVPSHLLPPAGSADHRRHPQLLLEYTSDHGDPAGPAGVEVSRLDEGGATGTRFDLEVHVLDRAGALSIEGRYAPAVPAGAAISFGRGLIDFLARASKESG